jgi:hypothetical protein
VIAGEGTLDPHQLVAVERKMNGPLLVGVDPQPDELAVFAPVLGRLESELCRTSP